MSSIKLAPANATRQTWLRLSPRNDVTALGVPWANRKAWSGAGRIVELPSLPTLSDGSAGGIEPDAITFPMCRDLLDNYLLVSEEEITAAIRLSLDKLHMLIEGAAGVALAALLQHQAQLRGQRVVVILCGANISLAALRGVLAQP